MALIMSDIINMHIYIAMYTHAGYIAIHKAMYILYT